jgi:hypothetical protein
MIRRILYTVFFTVIMNINVCSQSFWNITPNIGEYMAVEDTTAEHLMRIIEERDPPYAVYSAARILYYQEGEAVKDFILEHTKMEFTSDDHSFRSWHWLNYFEYLRFLYNYGEENYIEGAKTIAEHPEAPDDVQMLAIGALAELGYLDYLQKVKTLYAKEGYFLGYFLVSLVLERYGKYEEYRLEVGDIFSDVILTSNDNIQVSRAARSLVKFDKERAILVLDERFRNSEGDVRFSIFIALNRYDPDNQPERVMWVVPREENSRNRSYFIPTYSSIVNWNESTRYLEPQFVSFLLDWFNNEFDEGIQTRIRRSFLEVFKPLPPQPDTPVQEMLEDLRDLLGNIIGYNMIGDQLLIQELEGYITEAIGQVNIGNEPEAARQLTAFQTVVSDKRENTIESEEQGTPLPQRFITNEGYRYLYYAVGYILDRLPDPGDIPDPPGTGIDCVSDNPVTQVSGTITINAGETRGLTGSFTGSVFFQGAGTLDVCGTATFQNVYGNQPGVINISETGNVTIGNWNNNYADDAINNWGALAFTNWTTVNNGTITNHGDITVSGGLNQNNGIFVNYGNMTITQSVTLNQPGNVTEGYLSIQGTLTLNNAASLENSCRMEVGGGFMVNGNYNGREGSFTSVAADVTVNSGGTLSLGGSGAMLSSERFSLNGTIGSSGLNLITVINPLVYNTGAAVNVTQGPLHLCAPNVHTLMNVFDVSDGCQMVIPQSECNPQGYNAN